MAKSVKEMTRVRAIMSAVAASSAAFLVLVASHPFVAGAAAASGGFRERGECDGRKDHGQDVKNGEASEMVISTLVIFRNLRRGS